jgi:anti-sigma regulatory factor (Ser/Thr protein kinase)/DNA-binding response OmpR family regulator
MMNTGNLTAKGSSVRSELDERVLLLAPSGRDAPLAAAALRAAAIPVTTSADMDSLTRALTAGAGVAVIAKEALTPPALDSLVQTLSRQPPWSDLPLVVLTGNGRSSDNAESLLLAVSGLGNATLLERPLRIQTLVRAVRVALRSRQRQYEIREHLTERERASAERVALAEQQRVFLRDVLASVTEGKLSLCNSPADLPPPLTPAGPPIELTGRALRSLRQQTETAARRCEFPTERTHDLLTAVNEAGMNAVVHAAGGTASVGVSIAGNGANATVQVWIADHGAGIDVSRLPKATLERGYSSAGTFGHGFWMMLKATDRTYLLTGPQGTTVVIEQDRVAPSPAWMAYL